MQKYVFILVAMLVCATAWSQHVTLMLQDETLASALRQIDHAQQERRIVFVLDGLDSLRVTRNIFRRSAIDAVNEVCEGYPILITEHDADIFVEYVRPPVRLLPNATITRRQLHYDADGYTVHLNRSGLTGLQLLSLLPDLTYQGEELLLDGLPVLAYYLNGEQLTDADELLQLPSELIESVRVNHRTRTIHVTLRKPKDGGYHGSLVAEADCYESSMENRVGAVWYSSHGKTSIYNRFDATMGDVAHRIKQSSLSSATLPEGTTTHAAALQNSLLKTSEQSFSNRLSITRKLSARNELGLSYYVASHRGQAKVQRDNASGFIDFNGRNRHVDQELTLRYTLKSADRHNTMFEYVADYFQRQTTSENVSLYGAGVGTEMGEAPSISMWKLAMAYHIPLSRCLTLDSNGYARLLSSSYDPQRYLSNFEGSSALLYAMKQFGVMLKGTIGISMRWQRVKAEAGLTEQFYMVSDKILGHGKFSFRAQGGLYPYFQLHCPIDETRRHQVTLSWQRELEDLPYAAMSPAVRWSDAFNYSIGNRTLQAPETERLMLNASGWDGQLCASASYVRMHDEIYWQSAISSGQTNIFYTHPINLPTTHLWILQTEANIHPAAHWQMKVDALWQLRPEDTTIGDQCYKGHHWRQQYSCYNIIDCGHGWNVLLHASYVPTYHIYDRTYHSSNSLRGEIQRAFFADRLRCSLTFTMWGSDRCLDRQIGSTRVDYRYLDSKPHIGLRATWKFDGGRTVKVSTVGGAQQYNDIKDY